MSQAEQALAEVPPEREAGGRHRAPPPPRWRRFAPVVAVVAAGMVVVLAVLLVPSGPRREEGGPGGPPSGDWRQVFADEFDGTSLDRTVWQPDRTGSLAGVPFNPVPEDAWFDPENVTVGGGRLTLSVQQEPRTVAGMDYGLSSGMVQTLPVMPVTPTSYVEARIRMPDCSGCWPAFWLHPLDRWPPEIDIAEYLESGSDSRPSFNYIDADEQKTGPDAYGDPDEDYRGEFHTYGVLWEGDRAVPYLDGVPYGEAAATGGAPDLPMMIILNLSVRGGYDVPENAQLQVDWVRIWRPA